NSRTAWALLEVALATDHKEFLQGATRHLEWVANQQLKNGGFRYSAFSPEQDPFLHPIAYTVQGLLESGLRLGDKRYQKAAQLACDALVGHVSGGHRELIRDGETGILFKAGNGKSLKESLQRALDDKTLIGRLTHQAYHWVCREREWKLTTEVYSKVHKLALGLMDSAATQLALTSLVTI